MPARNSIKRSDPVRCQVEFGGETVQVVFDRNAMTQRWVKQMQETPASVDVEIASRSLADILLEWDIVEEDGTPTPITVPVLADLPLAFIFALDEAIGEAGVPGSEEGNASKTISSTPSSASTGKQESPLNGPQPSVTPALSASPSLTHPT
jgi:hypothetical protein